VARQLGGWITNTGSALVSFATLVPLAIVGWPARTADPTMSDIALLTGVGVAVLLLDFVMYQLLAIAPVAIVYPIIASNSAVVTVLAVVILGEQLSPTQIAGVILVALGVAGIAMRRPTPPGPGEDPGAVVAPVAGLAEEALSGATLLAGPNRGARATPRQASLSVIAGAVAVTVSAGVLLFIVADVTKRLGWYPPVFIDRAAQTVIIVTLLAIGVPPRAHLRGHASRWWLGVTVVGVLNAAAASLYGLGNQVGSTAITATAASTFAAVPVILGIALLGERPGRAQLVGIAGAVTGIVLLGAG
jgi:drug/metabolite transporter (DMT)-like permease